MDLVTATDAHVMATDAHVVATDAHVMVTDAHVTAIDAHVVATDAHVTATGAHVACLHLFPVETVSPPAPSGGQISVNSKRPLLLIPSWFPVANYAKHYGPRSAANSR